MSTHAERWWERVPRILGGWGLASLTLWKFFELGDAAVLPTRITYILLIAFFAGIAHSTVTGIVLGQLGRAYNFVKRGGKNRRDSVAAPGTALNMPAVDRRKRGRK